MAKSTWFKFKANKRDLEDTSNVEKDDGSLGSPTKKARGCGSKDSRVKLWIQGEEEAEEGWGQLTCKSLAMGGQSRGRGPGRINFVLSDI